MTDPTNSTDAEHETMHDNPDHLGKHGGDDDQPQQQPEPSPGDPATDDEDTGDELDEDDTTTSP
jgi:hypothetical protein